MPLSTNSDEGDGVSLFIYQMCPCDIGVCMLNDFRLFLSPWPGGGGSHGALAEKLGKPNAAYISPPPPPCVPAIHVIR